MALYFGLLMRQALHCSEAASGLLGRRSAAGRSSGHSDGRFLSDALVLDGALDGNLLGQALQRVLSFKLLELLGSVLLEEGIDRQETTTDTDLDVVLLNLDHDLSGAELVDTGGLSHEHDLQLASFGVVVDVLGETLVDIILLDRNVDSDSLLEVNDVLLERFNLDLGILQLLEELKRSLVGSVHLLLEVDDVLGRLIKLLLELGLLGGQLDVESLGRGQLCLDILLLDDDLLKGDDGGLEAVNLGLQSLDGNVLLVDLAGGAGAQLLELLLKLGDLSVLGDTHLNE